MKTIIAIVGRSGSGKTTIQELLSKYYNIPPIRSHTTRPRRTPSENSHVFLTDAEFDDMKDPLAETVYGGYRYAGIMMEESDVYTYVIDERGLKMLMASPYNVVSILVTSDEETLQKRVDAERLKRDEPIDSVTNFDYICENNGSLDDLRTKAVDIIWDIKINLYKNGIERVSE
jgi:guanylate kinase